MKQIEDCYTLELIEAAVKRGRGRPRKDNALTPAQRAKRYRQRQALKRTMATGSLSFSVLCEMTLQRMAPVCWS